MEKFILSKIKILKGKMGVISRLRSLSFIKTGEKISDIGTGSDFAMLLDKKGKVLVFGSNDRNITGSPGKYLIKFPQEVALEEKIKSIKCGLSHCLALTVNNEVIGWGSNESGQIPHGEKGPTSKPCRWKVLALDMAGGEGGTTIVTKNNEVFCFGADFTSNSLRDSYHPYRVKGLPPVQKIAGGWGYSLALDYNGEVWTWGMDFQAIQARNRLQNNSTPVKIDGVDKAVLKIPFSFGSGRALEYFNLENIIREFNKEAMYL